MPHLQLHQLPRLQRKRGLLLRLHVRPVLQLLLRTQHHPPLLRMPYCAPSQGPRPPWISRRCATHLLPRPKAGLRREMTPRSLRLGAAGLGAQIRRVRHVMR